jgi:hypothetical protein
MSIGDESRSHVKYETTSTVSVVRGRWMKKMNGNKFVSLIFDIDIDINIRP